MAEQTYVPETMQALHLPPGPYDKSGPQGARLLIYDTDIPVPKPSPAQYLVKVQTAIPCVGEILSLACNDDTNSIADGVRDHGPIPGHEFSGKIISTPTEDHFNASGPRFKVGDEVFGLLSFERDGAAADYTLATQNEMAFKPTNVSAAEAATIPLAALTAWQAFFSHAGLDPDDGICNRPADGPLRVLITNAAGSEIGRQALSLLRCSALFPDHTSHMMGGGPRETAVWVCATGSRDELDVLRKQLGADAVTAATDIAAAFRENSWDPVDIVFDCLGNGGASLRQMHSPVVVKDNGHVLTICHPRSAHPEKPSEQEERAEIRARNLTSEVVIVKPNGVQLAMIARLVEKGQLKPANGYQVVDLLQGQEAMIQAERDKGPRGKVILRVDPAMD
jgi:NADPH:quinone reductase-like Zn-dependent oxidoreductase